MPGSSASTEQLMEYARRTTFETSSGAKRLDLAAFDPRLPVAQAERAVLPGLVWRAREVRASPA